MLTNHLNGTFVTKPGGNPPQSNVVSLIIKASAAVATTFAGTDIVAPTRLHWLAPASRTQSREFGNRNRSPEREHTARNRRSKYSVNAL